MWLLTNRNLIQFNKKNRSQLYNFYCDENYFSTPTNDLTIFVEGYVIERNRATRNLNKLDLLYDLYKKYGNSFIQKVKGNFIIIVMNVNGFSIFSDRFAINKFFYWINEDEYILSKDIRLITSNIIVKPAVENMAIYSLTYHFTGGKTIFNNVHHNTPGQVIEFKEKNFTFYNFWKPEHLLSLPNKNISIKELSESLMDSINSSINHIKKDRISLSLTGGADTRNLLALFLKQGIKPHLYTYGNPKSSDCIKAARIAKGLNLKHSIYNIKLDASSFEEYSKKIIKQSGGLASIHRAHRLISIEREKEYSDNMFLGTLGGEYVKGADEDDYIISNLLYENWNTTSYSDEKLINYLNIKRIKHNKDLLSSIHSFIQNEPYMVGEPIKRKHNSLSYITAHLHDAQDINLYNSVMENTFTPFLDIDYLELLFSSDYSFNKKEVVKNSIIRKIQNPLYSSKFLKVTFKPLLKYMYSGEHRPSEVLFNKYIAAGLKYSRKKILPNYPPNFPLSNWMEQFVMKNLPVCNDYKILKETFNLAQLVKDLNNSNHNPKESYWLKFTNPIMMRFIIEELSHE